MTCSPSIHLNFQVSFKISSQHSVHQEMCIYRPYRMADIGYLSLNSTRNAK